MLILMIYIHFVTDNDEGDNETLSFMHSQTVSVIYKVIIVENNDD